MDKVQEQLFLPTDWDAARPELTRKQFEMSRAVNQAADGRLVLARTVTAAGTMNAADGLILADASAGAMTITALDAGELINKVVVVKKIDASANLVYVKCSGSDTIEGSATRTLAVQYDSIRLCSSGSSTLWRV